MKAANVVLFDDLVIHFHKHGYRLYMVGGTSRDFLLGEIIHDFDFATDATPDEMRGFLPDANYRFANFGTVTFKYGGEHVEITTLREEGKYVDFRHPGSIKFVKTPDKDYKRRDFTINALYIDENYDILDYVYGQKDLQTKLLRMIGDPYIRLVEDPLRIVRALRFIVKFNLVIDPTLEQAMKEHFHLLTKLNPDKIQSERRKVDPQNLVVFDNLYAMYKSA